MLEYTGHPLLDVGTAALVAFAGKNYPEQLNVADLETVADYMAANYNQLPLRSFFTVVFPNADGFTQPAYFKQPGLQRLYVERVLYSFRPETPVQDKLDDFSGMPIVDVPLDAKDKIAPGRTDRRHIPLQTGAGVINFHPEGDPGLPISGLSLLAFHALPLGSAKCGGRLLAVHSDNPDIMRHFATAFLEENRRAIQTAQMAGDSKMPEPAQKFKTLIIHTLLEARQMQLEAQEEERPFSIMAYHLSNSGQGPDLDIYHLPSEIVRYLKDVSQAPLSAVWQRVVSAAWERPQLKRGQVDPPADFKPARNWVYEDLFRLAEDPYRFAPPFIRTHFLRRAYREADQKQTDPGDEDAPKSQAALVSWLLTESFLRRILNMKTDRIDAIRDFADALAVYVREENDRRFFRNFYMARRYDYLRLSLIKANERQVQRGGAPLLTLNGFIAIFEEGEELARTDWRLARDLVLIRMIEQLYADGWIGRNEDVIADLVEEEALEPESE